MVVLVQGPVAAVSHRGAPVLPNMARGHEKRQLIGLSFLSTGTSTRSMSMTSLEACRWTQSTRGSMRGANGATRN